MSFLKSWLLMFEVLELPQHYIFLNFIFIYQLWLGTRY